MTEPKIELIPARQAVCSDESVVLDVLIRITPPLPEVHFPRAPLNLALVIDRSGSMSEGKKMAYAREAATFAVTHLLPTDRVSITIFDNEVESIAPGGLAIDKPALVRQIKQIKPRGSTDLHGGWAEGGRQAEAGLVSDGVNRVILLSDGLANTGVVDPNTLAAEARGLAARGVGTTTMGIGDDYNEDLMEAMARAADGHYYYVESPTQLVDIFQTELQGLMDTIGQKVSLGLEPGAGAMVTEVLNDLQRTHDRPADAAQSSGGDARAGRRQAEAAAIVGTNQSARCATGVGRAPQRRAPRAGRGTGGVAGQADGGVVEPARRSRCAHAGRPLDGGPRQKEAAAAAERGDGTQTREWLVVARERLQSVPASSDTQTELTALDDLEAALQAGSEESFIKGSKFRAYRRSHSRPQSPPKPPGGPPRPRTLESADRQP